jgi:hypothetical protein
LKLSVWDELFNISRLLFALCVTMRVFRLFLSGLCVPNALQSRLRARVVRLQVQYTQQQLLRVLKTLLVVRSGGRLVKP